MITERETTAADRKSGLYYPHFSGLHGVVDQVYEPENEVCVEVDLDSLAPDFQRRHLGIEERAKQKWLNSLSDAERRGLSEVHKQLKLKYTVMVAPDDLLPEGRAKTRKPTETQLAAAEAAHLAELAQRARQTE